MNNFTYENQGTNTYLVYKVGEDDVLDNMSLGMLTNNKIPGLSGTLFTQMNEDKFIKYNISSKISVKSFFYGTVNRKRLLSVFKGVTDTMLSLDDYMIDINSILLDTDYVFVDASTYEVNMICLPVVNLENVSIYDFIKNIMFSTQFDQSENCDYVTRIINFLNSAPTFSISSFKQFIDGLIDKANSNPVANTSIVSGQGVFAPVTPMPNTANRVPGSTVGTAPARPVPPVKPVVPPVVKNEPAVISSENKKTSDQTKNISWLYLMQHYNKENAAAYKAQQEAKKQAGKKASAVKSKPAKKKNTNDSLGFAIPGQETPVVPVKAAPITNVQPKTQPQFVEAEKKDVAATPAIKQQTPPVTSIPQVPVFDDFTDFEGTVVIDASRQECQLSPHLVRRKTGEKIQINKPVFKIGRSSDLNDYNIQDNKFIGHCHCHIVTRNKEYFIVDDNSKNRTYVDGCMITGSTEVGISDGCIIRLADEDFEFKLY